MSNIFPQNQKGFSSKEAVISKSHHAMRSLSENYTICFYKNLLSIIFMKLAFSKMSQIETFLMHSIQNESKIATKSAEKAIKKGLKLNKIDQKYQDWKTLEGRKKTAHFCLPLKEGSLRVSYKKLPFFGYRWGTFLAGQLQWGSNLSVLRLGLRFFSVMSAHFQGVGYN